MVVEALNPKTAAFFLAFIPQFVEPSHGNVALQFAGFGMLTVGLNTAVYFVVASVAGGIRSGASSCVGVVRWMRLVSGGSMIALGVGLAAAQRT